MLGAKAQELYNNEAFSNACKSLEAEYIKAWANSHVNDAGGREALWMALQGLAGVRRHLAIVMQAGRLAKAELDQFTKKTRAAA